MTEMGAGADRLSPGPVTDKSVTFISPIGPIPAKSTRRGRYGTAEPAVGVGRGQVRDDLLVVQRPDAQGDGGG